jgi:trimethylamine--corrinoid protein Co-methyltransferase
LFDRRNFEDWAAAGSKTLRQRARQRVEDILESHQPESLPTGVQAEIDAVVDRARANDGTST